MQVEELKAVVDGATAEERLLLSAYLRLKTTGANGSLGIALTEAQKRMDAGQSVDLEKVWALHRDLEMLGL
jgi:hypothetical protein